LFLLVVITGCSNTDKTPKLVIPESPETGGYELETDAAYVTVLTDGNKKYTKFTAKSDVHEVELYEDATELILIDRVASNTSLYTESYSDVDVEVHFKHPLASVYDKLRKLDFSYKEEQDGYQIFHAVQTSIVPTQEQIDYTCYLLYITWIDGNDYLFQYFVYADGATLIAAEAPIEINDRITKDTNWRIDFENACIKNIETQEQVSFEILETTTGKALSPNGGSTLEEKKIYIYLYVDKDTGNLSELRYGSDENAMGIIVHILNATTVNKPETNTDMIPMDDETLQIDATLMSIVETFIQL